MQGLRNKLHDILRPNKSSPSRSEISPPVATSLGGDQPRVQNDVSPCVEETPSPLGEAIPPPNQARLPLKASSHIQVEIWTEAYDGLKKDEPETVEAYEKILSGQLSSGGPAIDVEGDHENIIQAATVTRRDQMKKLIEEGQARTERVANMKANVNEVVEPFNRLREVISLAVKSDPAASTAWLGITTLLDILASPLSEPGANREGMKYILERAEWYWNLSALVLDPDKVDESIEELQKSLKNNISKLYKKLLLYQMKSVCLYARSEPAVILRDLVKLDDWKAQIASIEKTAEGVRNNVSQFRGEDMSARFRSIDKHLEGVQTHLRSLAAAIQDLGLEQRQQHDNDHDKRFLNDLYDVDPRLEKSALEDLKGGMVKEAHDLVYDQSDFETLRADVSHDLIWITGHPGRGKTMFLCGVIERLIQQKQLRVVSYFFCRADRQKARSAKAVLRGLLWMICNQSWRIARRLRQEYEKQSRKLFDDDDSMVSVVLEKMLDDVLGEPAMRQAVIVVDAIDECDDDSIRTLLKAIARLSRDHPAQWIVSSRLFSIYRSIITSTAPGIITCHMELSEDVVSSAVHAFVKHKVNTLAEAKGYDEDLQNYVYTTLSAKANDTFLWVALVCLELDGLGVEPRHVTETLDTMPRGLDKLYQRMLDRAFKSNDARLCRQILPLVCLASRPLAFNELCTLVPGLQSLRESDLRGVVANCGSFLAIHGDEENSILAFIHQSAREYLMDQARENVFPLGLLHHHRQILGWALTNIKQLRRNIYNLPSLGVTIGEIVRPDPDPLSHLHYSCVHWLDHFNSLYGQVGWQASDGEALHAFIEADFLHWLEALGLIASTPRGITAFQQLVRFYREKGEFHELRVALDDARRFMLYNKTSIEVAPLQVYASALVFCPSSSVIRSNFKDELNWATLHPRNSGATWAQLIQELPCETWPSCMAFSADGLWLVTGITHYIGKSNSHEHFIEIWDVLASHRVQSFPIDYFINKVQFSADGSEVVVALSSGDVRRLEADSGRCIGSFTHDRRASRSVFSKETKFVAHSIYDHTLTVFRVATGEHVQNIKDVLSLCFSSDSSHLATRLTGNRVAMWRVGNDRPLWIIEADTRCLSFFGKEDQVAMRCKNDTIAIHAGDDGTLLRTIPCHPNIYSMAWLGSGLSFLSWGHKNTIKIWDDSGISCVQTLPVTEQSGNSKEEEGGWYTISTATNFVAWVGDPAIRLWDLTMRASPDALDEDPSPTRHSPVSQISFSPNPVNGPLFASYSHSGVKSGTWSIVTLNAAILLIMDTVQNLPSLQTANI